jgi:peptidoglycan/LPS O-acetylase OafA/YrhL
MTRVHGLEGARGVAAFIVYFHHFLLIFYPDFYFGDHNWINHFINADLAVSWFFVHSGFVLSYKIFSSTNKEAIFILKDQSLRRYFRLLPVVLFSITVTYVFMKLGLVYHQELMSFHYSKWLVNYLKFTPEFLNAIKESFWGIYFNFKSSTTFNPNLWTIGTELIGSYVLFSVLAPLKFFKRPGIVLLLIGLLSFKYKGIMCFFLGSSLCRLPKHKTPQLLLIIIFGLAIYLSDFSGPYGSYLRNISAFILMYAILQTTKIRDILNKSFFKWLGDVSYSLYAIHFLILVSLTSFIGSRMTEIPKTQMVIINFIISSLVLFFVSHFIYKWIDAPGILLSKKFSKKILKSG